MPKAYRRGIVYFCIHYSGLDELIGESIEDAGIGITEIFEDEMMEVEVLISPISIASSLTIMS
ncbi:hypothetical protein [Clostridium sp. DL-VIII]|uniref:hypothetical protein n=1 Tax=Clostridium sp. DL-VIII TaxID=641107 RepID=UPI00031D0E0B|nr:hypothetical protein [Clostridium sp. DL-VIII]